MMTIGNSLFDKELLNKVLLDKANAKQQYYAIGIDTYDKDALAYCLIRKVDVVIDVLLCKTMRDEKEFKEEVEKLSKYFNAEIFR